MCSYLEDTAQKKVQQALFHKLLLMVLYYLSCLLMICHYFYQERFK